MRSTDSPNQALGSNSSNTIKWTGQDIPCLGIKYGDILSTVIHTIACKVCDLTTALDLSTVDLSCLLNPPDLDPEDKTLLKLIQVLLDNQCTLESLVSAIGTGTSTSVDISTLNLKCLEVLDPFGNPIPQDLVHSLQSIVNQVCTTETDVATIKSEIVQMQSDISDLQIAPVYTEPDITTCITPTANGVSTQVPLIAADYCNYKSKVGSLTDIATAISRITSGENTDYASVVGWVGAPQTLAQLENNMAIIVTDLLDRVKVIEQTCCAPSCDKIKIGFTPTFDFQNQKVTVSFDNGSGTNIPAGFVDCGSTLTITDKNKVVKSFSNLAIANNSEAGPLNIGGLATGNLVFNFKTKFCLKDNTGTTILTCQDCVTQDVAYENDDCCSITNTSASTVTIVFSSCPIN